MYIKEEVEWSFVAYEDNQPVIDLIAKRPICLLGTLDELSLTPTPTPTLTPTPTPTPTRTRTLTLTLTLAATLTLT